MFFSSGIQDFPTDQWFQITNKGVYSATCTITNLSDTKVDLPYQWDPHGWTTHPPTAVSVNIEFLIQCTLGDGWEETTCSLKTTPFKDVMITSGAVEPGVVCNVCHDNGEARCPDQ